MRLSAATITDALGSLMCRVADVLSEMATALGEAAERAMSTAVAVEAMHRQAAAVRTAAENATQKKGPEVRAWLHLSVPECT